MGFQTQVERAAIAGDTRIADQARREAATQTARMRQGLPRHRDLIRKIVERGLPTI